MIIGGYFIGGYFLLFLVILRLWGVFYYKLLLNILSYIIIGYW